MNKVTHLFQRKKTLSLPREVVTSAVASMVSSLCLGNPSTKEPFLDREEYHQKFDEDVAFLSLLTERAILGLETGERDILLTKIYDYLENSSCK